MRQTRALSTRFTAKSLGMIVPGAPPRELLVAQNGEPEILTTA
jgi:hypothetical protein